jgi:hypothetical protein
MRFVARLCACAGLLFAAPACAQQGDVQYEMVEWKGRPLSPTPSEIAPVAGFLVIRGDQTYSLRLTLRGVDGSYLVIPSSGPYATQGEALALRPEPGVGGDWEGDVVRQPGPDGILRMRDGSTWRRVDSSPWQDGVYQATRVNGMSLPATWRGSPLEQIEETLVVSGGRYRSTSRWRYDGRERSNDASGAFEVRGQNAGFRPDDPFASGGTGNASWVRRPDGGLRLVYAAGDVWDYRRLPPDGPLPGIPVPERKEHVAARTVLEIRPGQTVEGEITGEDYLKGAQRADYFLLTAPQTRPVTVILSSDSLETLDVNPVMWENGNVVRGGARFVNASGSREKRIGVELRASDRIYLEVSARRGTVSARYTLRVVQGIVEGSREQ